MRKRGNHALFKKDIGKEKYKRKANEKHMLVKSKKSYMVLICIFICAIAITTTVYAYFTHKAVVTNNINLGYNKITLNENYIPPISMEKGISFTKEPYLTNIGNVDCYVRIKSVISDSRVADYLNINYNTTDYTYNANDGYWYYNKILAVGGKSESLFTTVSIAEDADDIVLDGFDIYVYAESVQTVEGKNMEETWNYFSN